MFPVNRFDPRKEDRRKKVENKKKRTEYGSQSNDSQNDPRKKKKKKSKNTQHNNNNHDKDVKHHDDSHSDARSIKKETPVVTSTLEYSPKVITNQNVSSSKIPSCGEKPEAATFQVIAPETNGAISSKKNLSSKITAEAFEDLDLDDAWLESSSSEKKKKTRSDDDDGDGNVDGDGDGNDKSLPLPFDPTDEIERALEMTRLPIVEAARRWGMADFLVKNLQSNGYEHFFPIQALTIPDTIITERHMTSLRIRDVCCAAPTGSGKTLAFVLPVLNSLASRRVRRLRALVILPSRDLAQQVYGVFDAYRKGSENDLRIGLAIGQTDFQAEQKKLILGDGDDDVDDISGDNTRNLTSQLRQSMDPGNLELSLDVMAYELEEYDKSDKSCRTKRKKIPAGGISAVDVLVCTPGRLVDHLDNTPGFTLQHLRWLVIDEADRLLSQSYHGWIQRVLDCVHTPPAPSIDSDDKNKITIDPVTYRRSEQDAFVTTTNTTEEGTSTDSKNISQRIQLRKLLYSATLTKDPQKLSSLRLINPKYFDAHDLKRRSSTGVNNNKENSLYRMPEQLEEYTIQCTTEQKPLVLLALLLEKLKEHEESATSFLDKKKKKKKMLIVVFTSSLESTHRLTRLLQLLFAANHYGTPPAEFSSALNQHQRSQLMNRCNDPNDRSVSVLICSDGMSRGMDLASVVAVIHYDVPVMAKTYVHRCGRTARAGQDGTAIAILKGKAQAGQFARLRRLIDNPEGVTKTSIKTSLVRDAIPLYKACLSCLKEVLAAEDRKDLKPFNPDLRLYHSF
mmetsp:Transcript_54700/g.61134  ORF Transcript_54700/g.61134 Transcript_54700/m.61134 type:complete len:791 (+) Transcript_54700:113-2485(+)